MTSIVANLGTRAQPAPAVEAREVTELRDFTAGAQCHSPDVHGWECRCDLRGQGGYGLKRDVTTVRRDPDRLLQDLAPVGSDVNVGGVAAQRAGEYGVHPDRLAFGLSHTGVHSGQELWTSETARRCPHRSVRDRHGHILSHVLDR